MGDLISRQAAIDAVDSETVSTNPEHFKSSEKFIKFMDDADIASFGKWQWANGFNTALTATTIQLKNLPSAEPEEDTIEMQEADIDETMKRLRDARVTILPSAEPVRKPDEWCVDCKEYDHEKNCCPRFNRVIKTALSSAEPSDVARDIATIIENEKDMRVLSAEPVRKGKWIEVYDADNLISGKCSVCGWEAHLYEDDVFGMPYCPNCGARLSEGEEDD